ncbi:hypothetical protein FBU30_000697 [Linnemannia zychae]|nr:hypothetical protein FBU30_000697 [Linnemannia zychae]
MVQEIVLDGLMAGLYLFAGAWQLYLTFADKLPMSQFYLNYGDGPGTQFLCPTDTYDDTIHCRLWQTQLVGCLACGVVFALITLIWIILFRRRPLAFKDLPESLKENEAITSPRMEEAAKKEAQQEREQEIAAIAAEAERRAALARPKPQTRPTHPYQQQQHQHQQYPVSHPANTTYLHHQNSGSYLNQGYSARESPLPQSNYSNDDNDNYYNSNYAQQQAAYEMVPTNQSGYGNHTGAIPAAIGSNVDSNNNRYYPVSAPGTSQIQHANYTNDYAYGQHNTEETHEDLSSQEVEAHLAYANQLREQQLYHEQMAEALQKQKQQKAMRMQQQQQFYDDGGLPPHSGSTANLYSNSSKPPISNGSTNIVAGGNSSSFVGPSTMAAAPLSRPSSDFAPASFGQNNVTSYSQQNRLMTPGSTRIAGSPQLYDDTATIPDSQYSYDRYRAEVLGDLRPQPSRSATAPGAPQDLSADSETSSYHDYKVQVSSPLADQHRASVVSSSNGTSVLQSNQGYMPPPPTKSRTMWS